MMAKSFNNWQKIADSIKPAAKAVVRKTAIDCKASIQAQIVANGQIDTGFMLSSVYAVTSDARYKSGFHSSYKDGQKALPELPPPTNDTEAYVAVAAEYAIHQNYGTAHIPGRPFFEPGIERARAGFDKAMQLIKQKMEEAAQ